MLKQRVLTALILGPLIIWSVLTFSHKALAIELGLILMLGGWEWARLAGITKQSGRIIYAFTVGVLLLSLTWVLHEYVNLLEPILYFVALWWLVATLLIFVSNKKPISVIEKINPQAIAINLLVGGFILSGAFVGLVALHHRFEEIGGTYILMLLILIWTADTLAYFSGKAFGKHKLAVNVSPGKTWEGVAGGVIATAIAAYIISVYLELEPSLTWNFILIAIIAIAFSIVGDLIVSLFKRRAGIKDSSQLLPGHGGILDRIDSLMSAAPFFLLGLLLVGIK